MGSARRSLGEISYADQVKASGGHFSTDGGPPAELITEPAQATDSEKFKMFRSKLFKKVEDENYVSQSDNSEEAENDEIQVDDEDVRKDEGFFRNSLRMQKDGLIDIQEIIKKR